MAEFCEIDGNGEVELVLEHLVTGLKHGLEMVAVFEFVSRFKVADVQNMSFMDYFLRTQRGPSSCPVGHSCSDESKISDHPDEYFDQ